MKLGDMLTYHISDHEVPIDFGVIPKKFKVKVRVAENVRNFH